MFIKTNDFALRKVLLDWYDISDWIDAFAVTLTLKRSIRAASGGYIQATPGDYEQNLRHFLNVLNKRLFGNRVRNGARPRCIAILEGDDVVRRHYHLLLEKPTHHSAEALTALIVWEWDRTR